jgi:methylenetetrahydrofolate--tRNA-(uracil-5-)-methyltransferase
MHRNTYINSPTHLSVTLQMKERPDVLFAGQITGVEGYIESAATGILAGINAANIAEGKPAVSPPELTGLGGLLKHITDADVKHFQPMHINFGLLPPVERVKGKRMKKSEKRAMAAERAIKAMEEWVNVGG